MRIIWTLLLVLALIIESSLSTIPLVLLVLLSATVISKNNFVFFLAFIFGLLLDLMTLKTLGASSIFFEIFVFLILLYQSKFEIATNLFVLAASFFGSLSYLFLLGYHNNLMFQAVFSSIIGLLLFKSMQKITSKKEVKEQHLKA